MTNGRLRLLYLTNAFPPGLRGRFPLASATEIRMAQALSKQAEISTVGLLPRNLWGQLGSKDNSFGLEHGLLLWDRRPELWHRWRSWRKLRRFYLEEVQKNGVLDALLVRNLQHVFNYFVRWLRSQPNHPLIVLVLADSGLGQPVSFSRRLRYLFKPIQFLEDQAVLWYDACMGFALESRRHFEPRGLPWLWMPSAFNFYYEPPPAETTLNGPIRFGYFGGLSERLGVLSMVRAFLNSGLVGPLRVCGFGELSNPLKELAAKHPNFHFDGLLPSQFDCLPWAQNVDVLINPRPRLDGLDNTFPSKLFEFAMTGKAILSTRIGGVDQVLGEAGLYLEPENFEDSLCQKLREVAAMDRTELQRRGTAIRNQVLKGFNWDEQARRMVEFLTNIVNSRRAF